MSKGQTAWCEEARVQGENGQTKRFHIFQQLCIKFLIRELLLIQLKVLMHELHCHYCHDL